MLHTERNIELYVDARGRTPYSEWIDEFKDLKTKAVIRARLNRIRLGNFGNCRSLGNNVHELKIDFGPGYRIYFGQEHITVILLCGGDKNSQAKDIKKAKEFWMDYKRRSDQ